MTRSRDTDDYWAAFCAATGQSGDYEVCAFGDSPAMMDELAMLVLSGRKRATAGLVASYEAEGEKIPEPGDHAVIVDGQDAPVGIFRTTDVRVGPLSSACSAFAWDEGEGDRTLEWWMDAHRAFFTRECDRLGIAFHDDIDVVFERFALVWPRP